MRKLIVSTFVVLCGTMQAQNLNHFGLKGEVKCVKDKFYECSESELKKMQNSNDCFSLEHQMDFTKDGFYIENKNKFFSIDNITREKKETATGYLEIVFKEEDGVKRKWSENYYDKQNVINKM